MLIVRLLVIGYRQVQRRHLQRVPETLHLGVRQGADCANLVVSCSRRRANNLDTVLYPYPSVCLDGALARGVTQAKLVTAADAALSILYCSIA